MSDDRKDEALEKLDEAREDAERAAEKASEAAEAAVEASAERLEVAVAEARGTLAEVSPRRRKRDRLMERARAVADRPVNLVSAVVLGIGDTMKEAVAEGREEAKRAYDRKWEHFDELTKRRREDDEKDENTDGKD